MSKAGARRRYLIGGAAFAAVLAVMAFYFWAACRQYPRWVLPSPGGYNGAYAEGLLAGHLYLKTPPPPEMARLADPYDPAQYGPYYAFDLSLLPGAILYLLLRHRPGAPPLRALGPADPDLPVRAVRRGPVPGAGLRLGRRPAGGRAPAAPSRASSPWLLALGTSVIAGGNTLAAPFLAAPYYAQVVQGVRVVLLRVAALGAVFLALQPGRRPGPWLALASLAAGLMVAARPVFLLATLLLGAALVAGIQRGIGRQNAPGRPTRWGVTLAAGLADRRRGRRLDVAQCRPFRLPPSEFGMRYPAIPGVDLRHPGCSFRRPIFRAQRAGPSLAGAVPSSGTFPFFATTTGGRWASSSSPAPSAGWRPG